MPGARNNIEKRFQKVHMAERAKNNPVLTVIDTQRQRIKPPASLLPEAKPVFEHVVNHAAPAHFKESEIHLVVLYSNAVWLAQFYCERIGAEGDVGQNHKNWESNARLALSIATRLRLTPSSRYDARSAAQKANQPEESDLLERY